MSRFTTRISINGPSGNIFSVLGAATSMMRQIRIDNTEIEKLSEAVMSAGSYKEALNHIREWFPVGDEDEENEAA